MKTDKKLDNTMYIIGWAGIGIITILAIIIGINGVGILSKMPPCMINRVTGLYCPGCGGTRATFALLRGKIIKSFMFHPVVPMVAIPAIWFMISQTIERISRGKIRIGMRYRIVYTWIILAIIVINFLVKNALLIFGHIALLG